ncbi:hypothetical protein BDP27DRAFT_1369678 [Rhodocollybia butyracea]|uniref:Uncharacterized protein n=1 Tax=Rhodocollybia butyracea TaxID=206335 RepID=A0A9P5U1B0_9AGAR|nr:hypothetical protein BDP27DRAFT_1369678 [Rhodocollybia butyracea]
MAEMEEILAVVVQQQQQQFLGSFLVLLVPFPLLLSLSLFPLRFLLIKPPRKLHINITIFLHAVLPLPLPAVELSDKLSWDEYIEGWGCGRRGMCGMCWDRRRRRGVCRESRRRRMCMGRWGPLRCDDGWARHREVEATGVAPLGMDQESLGKETGIPVLNGWSEFRGIWIGSITLMVLESSTCKDWEHYYHGYVVQFHCGQTLVLESMRDKDLAGPGFNAVGTGAGPVLATPGLGAGLFSAE